MSEQSTSWLVGADDFATETQACAGWTFFALPESKAASFEASGREILNHHGLGSFHGKKYRMEERNTYRAFLQLIRETLGDDGLAGNTLFSPEFRSDLTGFAKKVTSEAIQEAIPGLRERAQAVAAYSPVLFTVLRVLQPLGEQCSIRLHLDDDLSLPDIDESKVIALPLRCSSQRLLKIASNGYRLQQFPDAPQFGEYPVEKMRDNQCMLIQAADVIGNFSMAHVYAQLGHSSKKRIVKAEILSEVFGDAVNSFEFSSRIELKGNDFCLKEGGALTFYIKLEADS